MIFQSNRNSKFYNTKFNKKFVFVISRFHVNFKIELNFYFKIKKESLEIKKK